MSLPPYTIPPYDADLWSAGLVLTPERVADTRLYNATRGADGAEYLTRVRAARLAKGGERSARGRVNWYRYLIGLGFATPDLTSDQIRAHLAAARERWGAEEWARVVREAGR